MKKHRNKRETMNDAIHLKLLYPRGMIALALNDTSTATRSERRDRRKAPADYRQLRQFNSPITLPPALRNKSQQQSWHSQRKASTRETPITGGHRGNWSLVSADLMARNRLIGQSFFFRLAFSSQLTVTSGAVKSNSLYLINASYKLRVNLFSPFFETIKRSRSAEQTLPSSFCLINAKLYDTSTVTRLS